MKMKGSQTEKNLLAAFAGESQARNRYTYFACDSPANAARRIAGKKPLHVFCERGKKRGVRTDISYIFGDSG